MPVIFKVSRIFRQFPFSYRRQLFQDIKTPTLRKYRFIVAEKLTRYIIAQRMNERQNKIGDILDKYHFAHFDYDSVGIVVLNDKDEVLLIKSNRYITQLLVLFCGL